MKSIPLTQGQVAFIDDADYERVAQFRWRASRYKHTFYAKRREKGRQVLLHRFLLDAPAGIEVDHRDGNGLNCQGYNLRLATHAENGRNRRRNSNNTSGYRGVSLHKRRNSNPWEASIMINRRPIHLGYFATAQDAGRAYDAAALELHGDFARINGVGVSA